MPCCHPCRQTDQGTTPLPPLQGLSYYMGPQGPHSVDHQREQPNLSKTALQLARNPTISHPIALCPSGADSALPSVQNYGLGTDTNGLDAGWAPQVQCAYTLAARRGRHLILTWSKEYASGPPDTMSQALPTSGTKVHQFHCLVAGAQRNRIQTPLFLMHMQCRSHP